MHASENPAATGRQGQAMAPVRMSPLTGLTSTGGVSPALMVGTTSRSRRYAACVPRPRGSTPRMSTACADASSSMATIASPSVDELRQPARGQRQMGSAILDTLRAGSAGHHVRDRLREHTDLRAKRLGRDREDAEAEVRAARLLEPDGQPGPGRVHQLEARARRPRAASRPGRCGRSPARPRHPRPRTGRRERIVPSSTETSGLPCAALSSIRHDRLGVLECPARGRLDRRGAAVVERVLQVPWRALRPEVAALEQFADASERARQHGIRTGALDGRVQHREVGGEALEAERRRHVRGVQQPAGVGQRQRRRPGAEGARVDQREALALHELHAARRRRSRGRPSAPGPRRRSSRATAPPAAGRRSAPARDAPRGRAGCTSWLPAIWLANTSIAARTTSGGAGGPTPARLSAICRQLKPESSRCWRVRFCTPSPVVSPYTGSPRSATRSARALAARHALERLGGELDPFSPARDPRRHRRRVRSCACQHNGHSASGIPVLAGRGSRGMLPGRHTWISDEGARTKGRQVYRIRGFSTAYRMSATRLATT